MSSLTVNDILEELLEENRRLLTELLFAHKVVVKSLQFKVFIDLIANNFVHNLKPDVKKKYEELSLGLSLLIHQKWANISDESPNESKTVNVIKSTTSDQSIETDSDYHTINEDSVSDVFELNILYCRPESQFVSTESQPEYNWSDIEVEEEKEMVTENMVTLDKCKNKVSDNEENLGEEHLVEDSVTDKPSVRTENLSYKLMTITTAKAVSGQQSSDDFNLTSKPSASVLRERKAMIFSTKLHQWKCNFPGCDYQNKNKSKVKRHLRKHSKNRPFECQHCHKKYKHKSDLRRHMKTQHLDQCPNDPILVCDWNECQYTTKLLTALNLHKRVHTLPFECQICKQRFSAKVLVKSHSTSKHNDK